MINASRSAILASEVASVTLSFVGELGVATRNTFTHRSRRRCGGKRLPRCPRRPCNRECRLRPGPAAPVGRPFLVRRALPLCMEAAVMTGSVAGRRALPDDMSPDAPSAVIALVRRDAPDARMAARDRLRQRMRPDLAKRGITVAAPWLIVSARTRRSKRKRDPARMLVARINAQLTPEALQLLHHMLRTELLQLPVAADAADVCGVLVVARA